MTSETGHVRMLGKEVFKHAVSKLGSVIKETLVANNLSSDDIDWLVPHQANRRIIESMAKIDMPMDKVICCIDRHAKYLCSLCPLGASEGVSDGRIIVDGNLVLFEAIGGGLAWGGLVRMGYPK